MLWNWLKIIEVYYELQLKQLSMNVEHIVTIQATTAAHTKQKVFLIEKIISMRY